MAYSDFIACGHVGFHYLIMPWDQCHHRYFFLYLLYHKNLTKLYRVLAILSALGLSIQFLPWLFGNFHWKLDVKPWAWYPPNLIDIPLRQSQQFNMFWWLLTHCQVQKPTLSVNFTIKKRDMSQTSRMNILDLHGYITMMSGWSLIKLGWISQRDYESWWSWFYFQGHRKMLNTYKCFDVLVATFLWSLEQKYSASEPCYGVTYFTLPMFVCPSVWYLEAALTIIHIFRGQLWSWIMSQVWMGLCFAGQMAVCWDAFCSRTCSLRLLKFYRIMNYH